MGFCLILGLREFSYFRDDQWGKQREGGTAWTYPRLQSNCSPHVCWFVTQRSGGPQPQGHRYYRIWSPADRWKSRMGKVNLKLMTMYSICAFVRKTHFYTILDKSSTAATLAHHYSGVCLSVDAVVTDVLLHGTSPVSLTARGLYHSAAAAYAEKEVKELGRYQIQYVHLILFCESCSGS